MTNTKRTSNKVTKNVETKKLSTIETLTKAIDMQSTDIEKMRREQQKTLDKLTIESLLAELKQTFSNLDFSIMSNKYYYCINVKRDNKLICKYWAKQIFARLVINNKLLDKVTSIDIAKRYAIHNEEVFKNELLCTYAESINVLRDISTKTETDKASETDKETKKSEITKK